MTSSQTGNLFLAGAGGGLFLLLCFFIFHIFFSGCYAQWSVLDRDQYGGTEKCYSNNYYSILDEIILQYVNK